MRNVELLELTARLPLRDGVTYRDSWGHEHTVAGTTANYPDWVYTQTGNWFDRETGYAIGYSQKSGHYVNASEYYRLRQET